MNHDVEMYENSMPNRAKLGQKNSNKILHKTLRILYLLSSNGVSQKQLVEYIGMSRQALAYHIHKLLEDDLIYDDTPNSNKWKFYGITASGQKILAEYENVSKKELKGIENANRRSDITIFINGISISLIELKNAANEKATISNAYHQFQIYKKDIPTIFVYNEILVISDGIKTKVGTLTADKDRFMSLRSLEQKDSEVELEVVIKEIFRKDRILDILQNFILFETDGSEIIKNELIPNCSHQKDMQDVDSNGNRYCMDCNWDL